MNERIENLMYHAGLTAQGCWDNMDEYDRAAIEKFAELLLKECANLAKTKSDSIVERAMTYAEDADEETSAKATAWQFLVFEQEIKKHFGVEE